MRVKLASDPATDSYPSEVTEKTTKKPTEASTPCCKSGLGLHLKKEEVS